MLDTRKLGEITYQMGEIAKLSPDQQMGAFMRLFPGLKGVLTADNIIRAVEGLKGGVSSELLLNAMMSPIMGAICKDMGLPQQLIDQVKPMLMPMCAPMLGPMFDELRKELNQTGPNKMSREEERKELGFVLASMFGDSTDALEGSARGKALDDDEPLIRSKAKSSSTATPSGGVIAGNIILGILTAGIFHAFYYLIKAIHEYRTGKKMASDPISFFGQKISAAREERQSRLAFSVRV